MEVNLRSHDISFPTTLSNSNPEAFAPNKELLNRLVNLDVEATVKVNSVEYERQRGHEQTEASFKYSPKDPVNTSPRIHIHTEGSWGIEGAIPQRIWDIDLTQTESLEDGSLASRVDTYTPDGKLYCVKKNIFTDPTQFDLKSPVPRDYSFASYTLEEKHGVKYVTIGLTDDPDQGAQIILAEFEITGKGLMPRNSNAKIGEVYFKIAQEVKSFFGE